MKNVRKTAEAVTAQPPRSPARSNVGVGFWKNVVPLFPDGLGGCRLGFEFVSMATAGKAGRLSPIVFPVVSEI
jgi:hypothetical protein